MGKTLDYVLIGTGVLLGALLIAMAVDTARRMNIDAPEESDDSDE